MKKSPDLLRRFCFVASFTAAGSFPLTLYGQENGAASSSAPQMPSLWNLAIQGGWFMIPIAIASVITVMFTIERLNGLRRNRILPKALILKLRDLIKHPQIDPRRLWEACDGNNSPLARVARVAVLKTGRPHAEVEEAVVDAVRRETRDMTRNLRPINVVASIAPLLGLLGTVQGMIMAFMVTSTTSSTGTAKAQELAHGIYTALVTTFAGLCVAVVSVILANFLEGRVERLLAQMEAIFLDLLPRLEAFEGRLRVAEAVDGDTGGIRVRPAPTAATAQTPAKSNETESTSRAAARRLGTPRRTRRSAQAKPAEPTPSQEPAEPAVSPSDEQQALETLRANFDR